MRHAADVLDEVGRHLGRVTDPVAAQGQRVDEAAEAGFDPADDLVVAPDRGKEMRDIVGHLLGHLVPFPLPGQRVQLEAEIFGFYELGLVKPAAATLFPLERAGEALAALRDRRVDGRPVLRLRDG